VKAERHVRVVADHGIVELEAEFEPAIRRPAAARVELSVPGIDQERVLRRVELDVGRSEANELVDLLAEDLGDVGEESLQARVGAVPRLRAPEIGE
jgi:hypothetical protein